MYYSAAKDGTFKGKGWPESAYGTSKIGVTLMSFVQQKELNKDSRDDIVVNAVGLYFFFLVLGENTHMTCMRGDRV